MLYISDEVLRDDGKWRNILFHKCCYHQAAFIITSKSDKGTEGIKERNKGVRNGDTKYIFFRLISTGLLH